MRDLSTYLIRWECLRNASAVVLLLPQYGNWINCNCDREECFVAGNVSLGQKIYVAAKFATACRRFSKCFFAKSTASLVWFRFYFFTKKNTFEMSTGNRRQFNQNCLWEVHIFQSHQFPAIHIFSLDYLKKYNLLLTKSWDIYFHLVFKTNFNMACLKLR